MEGKAKMQLIDVGGPLKTSSLKGSKYYIAFIDDCTKYCWIYFLKFKYEVSNVIWKYKAFCEKSEWLQNSSDKNR